MSREPSLPGSAVLLHPFEGRTSGGSAGSVDPRSAEAAPRPVLFGEVATGSGTSQLLSNPSERPTGVMRRRVVRAPHKEGLGGRGGGGGSRDGMVAAGCGNGGARAKRSLNTAMRDTRLSGGTPSKGQGGWRVDINGNPLPPSPGKIVLGTAVAEEGVRMTMTMRRMERSTMMRRTRTTRSGRSLLCLRTTNAHLRAGAVTRPCRTQSPTPTNSHKHWCRRGAVAPHRACPAKRD